MSLAKAMQEYATSNDETLQKLIAVCREMAEALGRLEGRVAALEQTRSSVQEGSDV